MHVPPPSFAGAKTTPAPLVPMKTGAYSAPDVRRLAIMGGAYGNVPAFQASLAHARQIGCDGYAFLGDATGCCGHSDETLELVRANFPLLVAGNHEQQAAAGSLACGCNYASAEDEYYGGLAHQYAMKSLGEDNRAWLGTWPDRAILQTAAGPVLLCHGSPRQTNEFLYESELDRAQLEGWLAEFGVIGLACTHSGFPWVRRFEEGR